MRVLVEYCVLIHCVSESPYSYVELGLARWGSSPFSWRIRPQSHLDFGLENDELSWGSGLIIIINVANESINFISLCSATMASFAQKAPNIVRGAALAASFAVLAHAQDDDLGIPSHIQTQDQAQAPPVEVAVNTTSGDYALVVDGIEWVASSSQASPPTLNGHHLELSRSTATNGTDRFGAYTRVALEWTSAAHPSGASAGSNHSSQPKVLLVTTYSTYVSIRILSSSCRGGSWLPTAPPPILLGLGGLMGGVIIITSSPT